MTDTIDPAQPFDGCWELYEQRKAAFLAQHPDATADEIEQACKRIAEEIGL